MKTHLNLMSMSYRRRYLIRRRLSQWGLLWSLSIAMLSLLMWAQWSQYHAGMARLGSLRREYEPIAVLQTDIDRIRQRLDDLQRRESLSLVLADERSLVTLVGVLSEAAQNCGGRVCIDSLNLDRRASSEGVNNVLTLNGVATDDIAVSRFTTALRDRQTFAHVELKSTGSGKVGDLSARTYSLECSF
jgi:Tfp pilus assembly protein PilN